MSSRRVLQGVLSILHPGEELGPVLLVVGAVCSQEPTHLMVRSFHLAISMWVLAEVRLTETPSFSTKPTHTVNWGPRSLTMSSGIPK